MYMTRVSNRMLLPVGTVISSTSAHDCSSGHDANVALPVCKQVAFVELLMQSLYSVTG